MIDVYNMAMSLCDRCPTASKVFRSMLDEAFGGTITEVISDGITVGYKLTNVVPGKAWDENGFRENDLLLFNTENPTPLDTAEDIHRLLITCAKDYKVMHFNNSPC